MNINDILNNLNADIIEKFKTAVEIGKWANGVPLTTEQRQICMQAIVVWEHQNVAEDARTGYIDRGTKKKDEQCDSDSPVTEQDDFKPIRFH